MTNETITEELRNLRNDIEKLKKELNIIWNLLSLVKVNIVHDNII
jgi:hypothetical protein